MKIDTMKSLNLQNIWPIPTIIELVDRSRIKIEDVIEDLIVSLDSWEHPVDFLILKPQSSLGGHPLILWIPWLATVAAFISCR